MEVTDPLVEKLAQLARLNFTDNEKAAIKNDLQKMIAFIHKLEEVDTANVQPLLHITDARNVLRADEVKNELSVQEAMQNAPLTDGAFFRVPKVIKK